MTSLGSNQTSIIEQSECNAVTDNTQHDQLLDISAVIAHRSPTNNDGQTNNSVTDSVVIEHNELTNGQPSNYRPRPIRHRSKRMIPGSGKYIKILHSKNVDDFSSIDLFYIICS